MFVTILGRPRAGLKARDMANWSRVRNITKEVTNDLSSVSDARAAPRAGAPSIDKTNYAEHHLLQAS